MESSNPTNNLGVISILLILSFGLAFSGCSEPFPKEPASNGITGPQSAPDPGMSNDPQTAELFRAVYNRDLPKVKSLIEGNPHLLHAKNKYGEGLIHNKRYQSYEVVAYLLCKGLDPNSRDSDGQTALAGAMILDREADLKVVTLLLDHGVDVNAPDNTPEYPIHHSCKMSDNGASLGLLLNAGAKFEVCNNFGETPLAFAARQNQFEQVKMLVDKGAKVNAPDKLGKTALTKAIHPDIVLFLLQHGADPNRFGVDDTVMHSAAQSESPGKLEILLGHGGNTKLRDIEGGTPLHAAVRARQVANVRLLLKHGADSNVKDSNGISPKELAEAINDPAIVEAFTLAERALK